MSIADSKESLILVAPFAGAWIEMIMIKSQTRKHNVAPFAGAWIEIRVGCSAPVSRVGRSLRGSVD